MSKTIIKRFGIGFQIMRVHYRDEKRNIGFKSAYAPVTIGYCKGRFVLRVKKPRGVQA